MIIGSEITLFNDKIYIDINQKDFTQNKYLKYFIDLKDNLLDNIFIALHARGATLSIIDSIILRFWKTTN